jgi:hypothetical protein
MYGPGSSLCRPSAIPAVALAKWLFTLLLTHLQLKSSGTGGSLSGALCTGVATCMLIDLPAVAQEDYVLGWCFCCSSLCALCVQLVLCTVD